MFSSHYQGKLFALAIAGLFLLTALIMLIIANGGMNKKSIVTMESKPGNVQMVDAKPCNVLEKALGGCK